MRSWQPGSRAKDILIALQTDNTMDLEFTRCDPKHSTLGEEIIKCGQVHSQESATPL